MRSTFEAGRLRKLAAELQKPACLFVLDKGGPRGPERKRWTKSAEAELGWL